MSFQEGIDGRIGEILTVLSFGEAAFGFRLKTCVRECAELQEAEGKELHGSTHRPCE